MIKILAFILYLIVVILVFLGTYGSIVQSYSKIQYNTTSLGLGLTNFVLLLIYCVWTFVTALQFSERYNINRFAIQAGILLLNILAVPLSVFFMILKNNTNYNTGPVVNLSLNSVLNVASLFITYACLNVLFYLALKIFKRKSA
jgi:hypothetical protein